MKLGWGTILQHKVWLTLAVLVIMIGLISTPLISGQIIVFVSAASSSVRSDQYSTTSTSQPIQIIFNGDFARYASSGDGSEANPYVIENKYIIANESMGVVIEYTNAYFVLRNITVVGTGSYHGFYFLSVTHGKVENCTARNNDYGFYLYSSDSLTLDNNLADSNNRGYYLKSTNNTNMWNNSALFNSYGFYLDHSHSNTLINNIADSNGNNGYFLFASASNLLNNNTASKNGGYGFKLDDSSTSYNVLENNTASYNSLTGFYLQWGRYNTMINNTSQYNEQHGFYLKKSNSNTFNDNKALYNAQQGFLLNSSNENELTCNLAKNNTESGYYLTDSNTTVLDNNTASYNNNYGFYLSTSSNNTLSNNTATQNNNYGFSLVSSSNNNTLQYNVAFDNVNGPFYISNTCIDNTLINNTFVNSHTLTAPNVIYPNGGEMLFGIVIIEWEPANDSLGHTVTYSLYYSENNGNSWTSLAEGLTTTSYNWDTTTVPEGPSYLIKVIADDRHGLTAEDTSDASFTIQQHILFDPMITYPNGGEVLSGNVTIEWNPANDTQGHAITYSIYYSADNGSTWTLIIDNITETSYVWDTTTIPDGGEYLVKVIADDGHGLTAEDTSDATFVIQNTQPPSSSTTTTAPPSNETSSTTSSSTSTAANATSEESTTPENTTNVGSVVTPGFAFLVWILALTSFSTVIILKRIRRRRYLKI